MTPIVHGDTTTGVGNKTNTVIFMRQGMIVDGKPARVHAISENALRSVIFRNPLHDDLIENLGIKTGDLPQSVVNLLFSGGNMASGSKAPGDEISLGHAVKNLYPTIDLLGGAVDGFILPRSRLKLSAWILSTEYVPMIRMVAPEFENLAMNASVYDMINEETRTRGTGDESIGNQMIYTYETLASGVNILIEITVDKHTPEETLSCVPRAIKCWDGFIGGHGRQGRGRMAILEHNIGEDDAYMAHIQNNHDQMREGLITGKFGTDKVLCAK